MQIYGNWKYLHKTIVVSYKIIELLCIIFIRSKHPQFISDSEKKTKEPEEDIFFIAISSLPPSRLSKSEACKINVKKDE